MNSAHTTTTTGHYRHHSIFSPLPQPNCCLGSPLALSDSLWLSSLHFSLSCKPYLRLSAEMRRKVMDETFGWIYDWRTDSVIAMNRFWSQVLCLIRIYERIFQLIVIAVKIILMEKHWLRLKEKIGANSKWN